MVPTASSEVAEALFKLIVGYILAYVLVGRGVEYGAAGAMLGVSSGAAAGHNKPSGPHGTAGRRQPQSLPTCP